MSVGTNSGSLYQTNLNADGVLYADSSGIVNSTSVGSIGQVLTSNGPGVAPTFQAASGGFAPNATLNQFDDFFGFTSPATGFVDGNMAWITDVTNPMNVAGTADAAHPGIITHGTLASGQTYVAASANSISTGNFIVGGGAITINFVFNIVNLGDGTNNYQMAIGFLDSLSFTHLIAALYNSQESLFWQAGTYSGSGTFITSAVTVTTGWHNLQLIINASGTSIVFSVDGSNIGTITTTIPTAPIFPIFNVQWESGVVAAGSVELDLVYMTQTLTTAR